ncbi:MAG: lysophospholipid acyltransferase family protein [Verrucomicrobia bacterium]|nr:lysophospholipid acyltransferase family protein [Verrucomicrobiota bacterium]
MSATTSSKGKIVVPHSVKWHQRLVSFLIVQSAKVVMLTWRARWSDRSGEFQGQQGPVIYCIWHNRLALSMFIYHRWTRKKRPAKGLAAVISASKDGGLLADVLGKFGVKAVRGSSSRRGNQALLEATTSAEHGFNIAITPDGPRGPKYKIQNGVVALAQLTGLPIIPVAAFISSKVCAKSWDNFQIPLPFAKCEIEFGEAIIIPRDATDEERERLRLQLEQALIAITRD